jgi:hypothetical protein
VNTNAQRSASDVQAANQFRWLAFQGSAVSQCNCDGIHNFGSIWHLFDVNSAGLLARAQRSPAGPRLTGEVPPVTATKDALQLARDRVARRLGSGRTALPPELGGGLFALALQAGPPNVSSQSDGGAPPGSVTSIVGSFGNTPERQANLSFLRPAITACAETLTERLDTLFWLHAGSRDRDHDATGMPIQGGAIRISAHFS